MRFRLLGVQIPEPPNGHLPHEKLPPGTEFLDAETKGQKLTRETGAAVEDPGPSVLCRGFLRTQLQIVNCP
jgi:hypothetical protein